MIATLTATLTAGYRSVTLIVPQPLEDDGVTPRTDFVGLRAWGSNTSGFTPAPSNMLFDGRGLSWTLEKLAPGVPVYVRYALISEIEPENYIVSNELFATPTEVPNSITVSNGVLQGVEGVGNGISIDNAYANRILEWNTDNALVYAHGSKVSFIGGALPPGGSIGAQCKLSTAPGASLTFSDDGGMWGVSIGLGMFGIPQYSVNFKKISSTQTKVTISGLNSYEAFIPTAGLKQVEIYPKTIEVYAENGALLLQHPWAGVQNDDVLVTLTVDLRSIDASVKNITFAQARYKVFAGSMQPGSVPANALEPVSLSSIGNLTPTTGGAPYFTAPGGPAGLYTTSSWFRQLWAPLAGAEAARTLLGLAAIATSGSASNLITGTIPDDRLPPRLRAQGTTVSSADLAIETGGPYYVDAGAPGNPFSEAAIIMVESKGANRITQRISRYLSDTPSDTGLMWRNYNFGVWSAWEPCPQTKSEQALFWSPVEHTEHSGLLRYSASLRGAVTQITSHTTPVTLNALQGSIKMAAGNIPAGGSVEFQFNNSYITESAMPIVIRRGTSFTSVTASVLRFAVGYCIVRVTNTGASAATGVDPAMSFVILGCATS